MTVKITEAKPESKANNLREELELINTRAKEGNWTRSSYLEKRNSFAKASGKSIEECEKLVPLLKF